MWMVMAMTGEIIKMRSETVIVKAPYFPKLCVYFFT